MAAERKGVSRGWTRDDARTMTLPMAEQRHGTPAKDTREARLKVALKANIARRKARARALEQTGTTLQEGKPSEAIPEED